MQKKLRTSGKEMSATMKSDCSPLFMTRLLNLKESHIPIDLKKSLDLSISINLSKLSHSFVHSIFKQFFLL